MIATALRTWRAKAEQKLLDVVEVTISRETLEAARTFSEHFLVSPEMMMEGQFYLELEALDDDLFSLLLRASARPDPIDPVTVKLSIFGETMEVTATVAKLLNRPLDWLMTTLVEEGVDIVSRQMNGAEEEGGIRADVDLQDSAKRILDLSLMARAGQFPKTVAHDAWTQLGLERPTAGKGGVQ